MHKLLPISILLFPVLISPVWAKDKNKDEDKDDEDDSEILREEEKGPSEEDFKEEEEEEDSSAAKPKNTEPDSKDEEEPKDGEDIDFTDPGEEDELEFGDDEDDEQETLKPQGPGEDTASLYRAAEKEYREMSPEEELIAWEQYLKKYPKSLFRDRIETRMEDLSSLLYSERVPGSDRGARNEDAAERELSFMSPIHMASVDTRQKLSVEAQWGYPSWIGFGLDYEHAFWREFSAHGGITRDLTGFALVGGAKYDILKSARTGTLFGVGLDFKGNTIPGFFGMKPAVYFGQRLPVLSGLDLQLMGAADMEIRDPFGVRWHGGFAAELRPSPIVSVYLETAVYMKAISGDVDTTFSFATGIFGLRFTPIVGDDEGHGRIEAGIAADAPYTYHYWGFYRGAVDLLGNYYF
jgi:nitrogen fixation-related uncharacterized protein